MLGDWPPHQWRWSPHVGVDGASMHRATTMARAVTPPRWPLQRCTRFETQQRRKKIKHEIDEKREHDHHGSFERFWRAPNAPIRNTHDPGHHHDRKPPGRDHSPRATAVVERWALPRPPPTASASPGEPGLCSVERRSRERSARAAAVNCASPRAPNPPHRCSYCPSRGPQAPPATRRRSANRLHRSLPTEQLRVPGRGVPH